MIKSSGIHHITAICGPAKQNFDFYTQVLGLRFIKKTVNFDDPGTYHFYYGDESGSAGTILTFFPWEGAARGKPGAGEVVAITFEIPKGSIAYWSQRLSSENVVFAVDAKAAKPIIAFHDPDGMALEFIEAEAVDHHLGWGLGGVPAEHAIRGFAGATMLVGALEKTAKVLTDVFGWSEQTRSTAHGFTRVRFAAPGEEKFGQHVDLLTHSDLEIANAGAGSVHHIAFRAASDADQAEMVKAAAALGIRATDQKDRNYFRAVYFREPSGILFEIATDAPGFTVDEPLATLGQALKLPKQFEPHRAKIEAVLVKLD